MAVNETAGAVSRRANQGHRHRRQAGDLLADQQTSSLGISYRTRVVRVAGGARPLGSCNGIARRTHDRRVHAHHGHAREGHGLRDWKYATGCLIKMDTEAKNPAVERPPATSDLVPVPEEAEV